MEPRRLSKDEVKDLTIALKRRADETFYHEVGDLHLVQLVAYAYDALIDPFTMGELSRTFEISASELKRNPQLIEYKKQPRVLVKKIIDEFIETATSFLELSAIIQKPLVTAVVAPPPVASIIREEARKRTVEEPKPAAAKQPEPIRGRKKPAPVQKVRAEAVQRAARNNGPWPEYPRESSQYIEDIMIDNQLPQVATVLISKGLTSFEVEKILPGQMSRPISVLRQQIQLLLPQGNFIVTPKDDRVVLYAEVIKEKRVSKELEKEFGYLKTDKKSVIIITLSKDLSINFAQREK